MPPTEHARLGASGSERWMNCPGSIALSEGLPDDSSWFADEGSYAHDLVEMLLSSRIKLQGGTAFDYVGQPWTWQNSDGVVDADMADSVMDMVLHVEERIEAVEEQYGDDNVTVHLEQSFDLAPLGPPEPMFGTGDVVIVAPGYLEVIDYKHGSGVVVEVTENSQVMMYALGASVANNMIPARVRVTIAQPRAHHPDGPIRSFVFDRSRLIEFKHELFTAAEATHDPEAPLAVGDWCKFCKARAACPAQLEHAQSTAMVEFDVQPEADLADMLPHPALLPIAKLAQILERAPIMMTWLRDVESYALTQLQQGQEIPDWKLVEGRRNRKWRDPDTAERFLARQGMKQKERCTLKLISPAQAEKKMKARGKDPAKLEKLWIKPEGAAKMAHASDPRPALASSAEEDFGALTEPHPGAGNTQDD